MGQFKLTQIDDVFVNVEKAIDNKNISEDFGSGPIIINPSFVRDDQDFIKNALGEGDIKYPFVTYRIINDPIEPLFNHIFENKSAGFENTDPKKPNNLNIRSIKVRPTISINIISDGEDGLDACNKIAREILEFFFITDLKDAVAFITDETIQNRTTEIDGEIEYKLGFDIDIEFTETIEKTGEAVREIGINTTTDTGSGTFNDKISQETN